MYAELQKFGKSHDEARQLILSEPQSDQQTDIEVMGLDFTTAENKAYSALQILLDSTNYQGNEQAQEVHSLAFSGRFKLPQLSFTYSEYFEAYGLKQYNGKYQGKQRAEALEALRSLAEKPRNIMYKRREWEGSGKHRKGVYKVIRYRGSLIQILEGYKDLSEHEASQLQAGKEMHSRVTRLAVQFGPLIVDSIDTFFLIKPAGLHKEIEEYLGARRYSPSVIRFCEWLLTWSKPVVKMRRDDLARKLRLDYMLEHRRVSELQKQLLQCFETAKALGFLLSYKEDAFGLLTFRLNPKRCLRLQAGEAEAEA